MGEFHFTFEVHMLAWLSLSVALAANPFRVEVQPVNMVKGETKEMLVTFVVPEGYHLYQDMMSVVPSTTDGLTFSAPVFPMGQLKTDPANPEQMREVFATPVQVKVPVTSTTTGIYMTELKVQYQGCKETLCYMPKTETMQTTIAVTTPETSEVQTK